MAGTVNQESVKQNPAFEVLRQDLTIYPPFANKAMAEKESKYKPPKIPQGAIYPQNHAGDRAVHVGEAAQNNPRHATAALPVRSHAPDVPGRPGAGR